MVIKFGILKGKRRVERTAKDEESDEVKNLEAAERLKSPQKTRDTVTIAPSTTPGPDVRLRP